MKMYLVREGVLPRVDLDDPHGPQPLVLPLHLATLELPRQPAAVDVKWDEEDEDGHAAEQRHAQLSVQKGQRQDDLKGHGPDHVQAGEHLLK